MDDWRKVDLSALDKQLEKFQRIADTMSFEECATLYKNALEDGFTCFQCGKEKRETLEDMRSLAADILYLADCL